MVDAVATRLLHSALLCAITLLLVSCGGGGGGGTAPPVVVAPQPCPAGAAWDGAQCKAYALRSVERLATPWVEAGQAITLELVVYRPLSGGPWPTLIFHHGSTGDGTDPRLFTQTFDSPAVAREFVERGFLVLFPQRRGRGQSGGTYDEGFGVDRSAGYACQATLALAGLNRAAADAEVIATQVRSRADVDAARIVVAGTSRGGALALVHAAQRPTWYRGVMNFVGGWLGQGCADALAVNRAALAGAATDLPTLWLYGDNDPFYSLSHSRSHFDAFVALGGQGIWFGLRRSDPAASGHLVHQEPGLWRGPLDTMLAAARLR